MLRYYTKFGNYKEIYEKIAISQGEEKVNRLSRKSLHPSTLIMHHNVLLQ